LLPVRISAPGTASTLELRSPSGWSMRIDAGVDAAWLARLLRELR
jgi:putative exporter of polyketide antibiotics